MPADLRICLALSGGASLGAYHAGAAAAVVTAVQALQRDGHRVVVDGIGGASAGALVSLFTAHALQEGIDAEWLLHEAWVERVSLDLLRGRDSRAPLSFDRLEEDLPGLLDEAAGHRVTAPQDVPLGLHVALTGLRGLRYAMPEARGDGPLTATTWADWGRFAFAPGGGPAQVLEPRGSSPLEFALASAANPGGFAPRRLDRTGDRDAYRGHGISDFPESGSLWYTDGGTIQAEPLGRVLGAARAVSGDDDGAERLLLLVDPRSEGPSGAQRWSDADAAPGWTGGLSRTLSILPAQILYDDLRRLEKQNSRRAAADALAATLAEHLADDDAGGLARALGAARARQPSDRAVLRDGDDPSTTPPPTDDLGAALREALRDVAGVAGKPPVRAGLISPLVLTDREDVPDDVTGLLAGELLGDFGGFVTKRLRRSDFALGYDSALTWLDDGLTTSGVPEDAAAAAVTAVRQRRRSRWEDVHQGSTTTSDLTWRERLRLARLGAHVIRVMAADVLRGVRG